MTPILPHSPLQLPSRHQPVTGTNAGPTSESQALAAVQDTLDLSSRRQSPHEILQTLDKEDQNTYLTTLSKLLKAGVVGTETFEVRGQPSTRFVSTRVGDSPLRRANSLRG